VLNPDVRDPQLLLMATGSEVHLIVAAEAALSRRGIRARLVSMPCWELFDEQPAEYRDQVLPPGLDARLAVETGVSLGWHRWIGRRGDLLTLDRFGASAPGGKLMTELGFTAEHVAERSARLIT
jgi:transketolase